MSDLQPFQASDTIELVSQRWRQRPSYRPASCRRLAPALQRKARTEAPISKESFSSYQQPPAAKQAALVLSASSAGEELSASNASLVTGAVTVITNSCVMRPPVPLSAWMVIGSGDPAVSAAATLRLATLMANRPPGLLVRVNV